MKPSFTIIYAFRNRDSDRVRLSLLSLKNQLKINFEVVFIDYGSTKHYSEKIENVIESFEFVKYHYIGHEGLLWNKSKALNYGITKASTNTIFIADVDILFSPNFSEIQETLIKSSQFTLFKIGYLPESITPLSIEKSSFKSLKSKHFGDTFGVGLFPKQALEKVGGLDVFFHFYGSEDADLNYRLIQSGCNLNRCEDSLLLHQWHERYPQKVKESLTKLPRLSNIQRINQQHFLWHKKEQIQVVENKNIYYSKSDYNVFDSPEKTFKIDNIKAKVIHFLNSEIQHYKGKVIKVVFYESNFYHTLKYKLRVLLKKQTQPYMSLKEINDLVLEKIVFKYRDFNYSYKISKNLKEIEFCIDLRSTEL